MSKSDINAKIAYLQKIGSGVKSTQSVLRKEKRALLIKKPVFSKNIKQRTKNCSKEMEVLFNCLKEHNLMNEKCQKELSSFLTCEKEVKEEKRENLKKGGKIHKQTISKLFQEYPSYLSKETEVILNNSVRYRAEHKCKDQQRKWPVDGDNLFKTKFK